MRGATASDWSQGFSSFPRWEREFDSRRSPPGISRRGRSPFPLSREGAARSPCLGTLLWYRLVMQSTLQRPATGVRTARLFAKVAPWRSGVRRRTALASLVVFAVGVPFILALTTHSLFIPHNDGWSYSKAAQLFAETGAIHLQNWNRSALIGQLVMLGPLGRWIWAQQTAMAVLGVAGLLLTYRILVRRLTPGRALLGTALVAVLPGYGLLSTSFMDTIPSFVAAVGCLAVADIALERRSPVLLATALAIGFFGVTIREEVLAAAAAVVVGALLAWGRARARTVIMMAAVFLVAFAVFEVWRSGLPYGDRPAIWLTPVIGLEHSARAYLTIALLLFPAVLVSGVLQRPSRRVLAMCVPGALVGFATVLRLHRSIFLGNYFRPDGAYAAAVFGAHIVIPAAAMTVLIVAALVSGVLLPAVIVTRWRDLDPMLATLGILTILGIIGESFLSEIVFDRDLIVLLLPGAVLCLRTRVPRTRLWMSAAPLAGLAAVSLLLCANAMARDAAVWEAADSLVARGVPATSIDAGLNWVGYHATTPVVRGLDQPGDPLDFWAPMFPDSRACYAITEGRKRGLTVLERIPFRTYAVFSTTKLHVYRLGPCPTRVSS